MTSSPSNPNSSNTGTTQADDAVSVVDIDRLPEAAYRQAVEAASQWCRADVVRQRQAAEARADAMEETGAPDSDEYLLSGLKLLIAAGNAAQVASQQYQAALASVQVAVPELAQLTDDQEKQRKSDVLVRQQGELGARVSECAAMATSIAETFDMLLVRYWALHPTRHGRLPASFVLVH